MPRLIPKLITLFLLLLIFKYRSFGQVSEEQIDKNKVSAFFQNEQYTDAIEYLESKKVSN